VLPGIRSRRASPRHVPWKLSPLHAGSVTPAPFPSHILEAFQSIILTFPTFLTQTRPPCARGSPCRCTFSRQLPQEPSGKELRSKTHGSRKGTSEKRLPLGRTGLGRAPPGERCPVHRWLRALAEPPSSVKSPVLGCSEMGGVQEGAEPLPAGSSAQTPPPASDAGAGFKFLLIGRGGIPSVPLMAGAGSDASVLPQHWDKGCCIAHGHCIHITTSHREQ